MSEHDPHSPHGLPGLQGTAGLPSPELAALVRRLADAVLARLAAEGVTGGSTGSVTGNQTGSVTGNLTDSVTGNLTGGVVGGGGAVVGGGGAVTGGGAPAGAPGRRVGWLLAAPSGHLAALTREMAVLQRLGHHQTVLACADVAAALGGELPVSRTVVLGEPGEPGATSASLAALAELDLLYVGSLGWAQARRVAALDDSGAAAGGGAGGGGADGGGAAAVALILEALSRGVPVRLLAGPGLGGLHGLAGDGQGGGQSQGGGPSQSRGGGPSQSQGGGPSQSNGAGQNPGQRNGKLAAEAARLGRGLSALGISPVRLEALGQPLAALEAERDSFGRALGGLLRESDVEAAVAEGWRELRLPRGTVVTPLARERARDLGLVLHEE